jgi:hypothetical protein
VYLALLDNNRSQACADEELSQILQCIRDSACDQLCRVKITIHKLLQGLCVESVKAKNSGPQMIKDEGSGRKTREVIVCRGR